MFYWKYDCKMLILCLTWRRIPKSEMLKEGVPVSSSAIMYLLHRRYLLIIKRDGRV